jgi:transcriptional regulator with XRE-family HTH domain
MTEPRPPENAETVGSRIKRFRIEKDMAPSELADKSGVSRSYISSLESGLERKLSAALLYDIASALGVAMSDLLGKEIITTARSNRNDALLKFAQDYRVPEADVEMLASIHFRGDQPTTPERWLVIYNAIVGSRRLDRT